MDRQLLIRMLNALMRDNYITNGDNIFVRDMFDNDNGAKATIEWVIPSLLNVDIGDSSDISEVEEIIDELANILNELDNDDYVRLIRLLLLISNLVYDDISGYSKKLEHPKDKKDDNNRPPMLTVAPVGNGLKKKKGKFTKNDAKQFINHEKINMSNKKFTINDVVMGMNVEREHKDVTHGDIIMTGKIAMAHLMEDPHYYVKLKLYVE
jgi:hypothetical protein